MLYGQRKVYLIKRNLLHVFNILIISEGIGFMWKITFGIFIKFFQNQFFNNNERPGLESQRSRKRFFLHIKIFKFFKYVKYEKNVSLQNCSFQYDLQILSGIVSNKTYICILISKNTIKIQKFHYLNKYVAYTKKTLRRKIICQSEVYKFSVGHFLTRCIFYVLVLKNTIKNQKFHFLTKICEIQNKS